MTAVRQVAPPSDVRSHSTLPRVDYVDAFVAEPLSAESRTAEEWARSILEDAPEQLRKSLRTGWSSLGLRIGPARADGYVLGWELRRSDPDLALLGARSRIGMPAELLVIREPGTLRFSTLVQFENRFARTLWAAITSFHQRVVLRVLEQASRRWTA